MDRAAGARPGRFLQLRLPGEPRGCQIHSANTVVPRWQDIDVGSEVHLHPDFALRVAAIDPGRALVLRGGIPLGSVVTPYDFTWTFVLLDLPSGTTRLIVRERYAYKRRWAPLVVEPASVVSFFMSRRMMHGIKSRAERALRDA